MSTSTPNYGLIKPTEVTDFIDVDQLNSNMDTIDTNLNRVDDDLTTHLALAHELTAVKSADKTVTSSTTLSDDSELVIPLAVNSKYRFEGYLIYSSSTTADAKFALTGPASATAQISGYGVPTTEASVFGTMNISVLAFGSDWQIGGAGVGTKRTCIPHASIVTGATSGNLTVQFAQVTSDATNTVLHIGSWIMVRKIA